MGTTMTFFILGNHPTISIAEIASVIGTDHDYSLATPEVLLVPDLYANLGDLQERLGSVIKTGSIIGELKEWNHEDLAQLIFAYSYEAVGKEKISFGISVYDTEGTQSKNELTKQLKRLGLETKKLLKETGRPVRYASSKELALSSVIVKTNSLLESGGEFVIILYKDKVLVGQTATVQDFEAWSDRDYGRPARDPKSGMLPPKLARTMINLSGVDPKGKTLLDPFCGSGTVLMEGILLGCKETIGGDISEKAIADTKKNLKWFARTHLEEPLELSLFKSPAKDLADQFEQQASLIIAETYLGPPRLGRESETKLRETIEELTKENIESFKTLYDLLKSDGRAVIAFPAYKLRENFLYLPILEELKKIGFKQINPLPDSIPTALNQTTPSGALLYKRANQHVAREIFVLEK